MTPVVIKKLVAKYIYAAMVSWVPLTNQYERDHVGHWLHTPTGLYVQENQEEAQARYEAIAEDVVDVAFDDANPPIFSGDDGRLKTALQLAGIASYEGHFWKWVADGDCNSPEFQASERAKAAQDPHYHPACDGGHAYSNFQIHLYNFVIKDGELFQAQWLEQSSKEEEREWIKTHKDSIITGKMLIADSRLAAQISYYLVRGSIKRTHSLCEYTGESCTTGHHPLAIQRTSRPMDYLRAHPFTMPTEAQIQLASVDENVN
jgi:hypothetical protein